MKSRKRNYFTSARINHDFIHTPSLRLSVDCSSYIYNTKMCQNPVNELQAYLRFISAGALRQTAVWDTMSLL
jgi:hypothetical protein